MKKYALLFLAVLMIGCSSSRGPSLINLTPDSQYRSAVAIVKLKQRVSFLVLSCDGNPIPRSAKYIVLAPGRHKIDFTISGSDLFMYYDMNNTKTFDVAAGRTYVFESKLGFFTKGNQWFPELVDVSHLFSEHVMEIPANY